MLKFVKKFTIIFVLFFTITIVKAEPGVLDVLFRSSGEFCSNKIEQISFKGKTSDLISITVIDERGKIILNKRVLLKSATINFDLPCGSYNLMIADLKNRSAKNYSIQLR